MALVLLIQLTLTGTLCTFCFKNITQRLPHTEASSITLHRSVCLFISQFGAGSIQDCAETIGPRKADAAHTQLCIHNSWRGCCVWLPLPDEISDKRAINGQTLVLECASNGQSIRLN